MRSAKRGGRAEELLEEVIARLERLEGLLKSISADPTTQLALDLVIAFQIPALKAVEMARRISDLAASIGDRDPISMAIIEAMAVSDKSMSISELTRKVRDVRGTASRRIVTQRVRALEKKGLISIIKAGKSMRVRLRR
jgi:DNA-binding transcriptional ArsR family regulator